MTKNREKTRNSADLRTIALPELPVETITDYRHRQRPWTGNGKSFWTCDSLFFLYSAKRSVYHFESPTILNAPWDEHSMMFFKRLVYLFHWTFCCTCTTIDHWAPLEKWHLGLNPDWTVWKSVKIHTLWVPVIRLGLSQLNTSLGGGEWKSENVKKLPQHHT